MLDTSYSKDAIQAHFGFYNFAILQFDNDKFIIKELFMNLNFANFCLEKYFKNENAVVIKPKFIISITQIDNQFDLKNVSQIYKVKFKACDIREIVAGVELIEFDDYFTAV